MSSMGRDGETVCLFVDSISKVGLGKWQNSDSEKQHAEPLGGRLRPAQAIRLSGVKGLPCN